MWHCLPIQDTVISGCLDSVMVMNYSILIRITFQVSEHGPTVSGNFPFDPGFSDNLERQIFRFGFTDPMDLALT